MSKDQDSDSYLINKINIRIEHFDNHMIKNLTNSAKQVLEYFFKHPTEEIHVRGIEKKIDMPYSSVRKALVELGEKELLSKREESKMTFFKARRENEEFQEMKRIFNLRKIFESGLADELEREYRPDAVVLFGSFLMGNDREESDIDIAVVNGREISIELGPFEDEFNREIQIVEVKNPKEEDVEFKNTLANGFVLTGQLEVI